MLCLLYQHTWLFLTLKSKTKRTKPSLSQFVVYFNFSSWFVEWSEGITFPTEAHLLLKLVRIPFGFISKRRANKTFLKHTGPLKWSNVFPMHCDHPHPYYVSLMTKDLCKFTNFLQYFCSLFFKNVSIIFLDIKDK